METREHGRTANPDFDTESDSASIVMFEPCPLRELQVGALVFNKMVGTAIFYTPAQVLILTGSNWAAMSIWIFGAMYTYISAFVYLEYASKWPYIGGEFLYILKVQPRPNLLFSTAFAYFFIVLSPPAPNSLLIAVNLWSKGKSEEDDKPYYWIVAGIVIIIVSVIHAIPGDWGISIAFWLAALKLAFFLVVLAILGLYSLLIHPNNSHVNICDMKHTLSSEVSTSITGTSITSYILAILLVLHTFQGWQNANYITSEISGDCQSSPHLATHLGRQKILKTSVLTAITLVVTIYLIFNTFLLLLLPYEIIKNHYDSISILYGLYNKVFESIPDGSNNPPEDSQKRLPVAIFIAISALGNIFSTIYTNTIVKKQIANHQLIPFSFYFGNTSHQGNSSHQKNITHSRDYHTKEEGSPIGGSLLLEVVSSIAAIVVIPIYNNSFEGITFFALLFTYGLSIAGILLGICFCRRDERIDQNKIGRPNPSILGSHETTSTLENWALDEFPVRSRESIWEVRVLAKTKVRFAIVSIFVVTNLMVVCLPWLSESLDNFDGSSSRIPIFSLFKCAGFTYFIGVLAAFYILLFARGFYYLRPRGPLEAKDVDGEYGSEVRLIYPQELLSPGSAVENLRKQLRVKIIEAENPIEAVPSDEIDNSDIDPAYPSTTGYYVLPKHRRWIFLFDDLGVQDFLCGTSNERILKVKNLFLGLFQRSTLENSSKRIERLTKRIIARGERELNAKAQIELEERIFILGLQRDGNVLRRPGGSSRMSRHASSTGG